MRGIGVGLIIAWVTGALAYFKSGPSTDMTLISFELVLSIVFLALSYMVGIDRKRSAAPTG